MKKIGKPAGLSNYVDVSLGSLNAIFKEAAMIKVSRRFAEANGLNGVDAEAVGGTDASNTDAPLDFKITELE